VALACLDAEVEILGPAGRRTLPVTQLHLSQAEAAEIPGLQSPAHAAQVETRLKPREIITGYRVPIREGERSAYVKVRERESFEYALVAAAAAVSVRDGVIALARLALGSVAQKPWRLPQAEAALVGQPLTRETVLPPIRAALGEARSLEHNGYKIEMAANAAMRALLAAGSPP
jgi:xanthine dehydrogenase YagS FAD-binding subunit